MNISSGLSPNVLIYIPGAVDVPVPYFSIYPFRNKAPAPGSLPVSDPVLFASGIGFSRSLYVTGRLPEIFGEHHRMNVNFRIESKEPGLCN